VLTNYSQVAQGARVKPVPPIITGGYTLHEGAGGFVVQLSNIQIIVVITTVVLLALHLAGGAHAARPRACAPASRTRPWRRCSASTSTAPSR
jgi:hypothetical protein